MSNTPRRLAIYVGSVAAVAALVLAAAALLLPHSAPRPAGPSIVAVAALAFAAILLRLEIRLGTHRWVLSWGDTAIALSFLLAPAAWVVLLTTAGKATASGITYNRRQPIKLIYNTAAHTIAAALAALTALTVGRTPLDARDARDVVALLLAGAVYDLVCELLTVVVIAVANGSKPASVWRAGLGLATLTMGGNLTVTAGVLALAGINHRLILLLPAAALVVQKAYQEAQRARIDRESARRLTEAITALGDLDEATILSRAAAHAASLLSAAGADVALYGASDGPDSVATTAAASPDRRSGARLPGPWWTETVRLLQPTDDEPAGEIRVHFAQPVRLTGRERGLLAALAAATRNALSAARAHADVEHLAAVLSREITHDSLTGLPTRQLLLEGVDEHLALLRNAAASTAAVGLVLIGLVEFSEVSRTLGHDARDDLLRHTAARLQRAATGGERVYRMEEDQFAVFAPEVNQVRDLRLRAESLLASLATPTRIEAGAVVLQAAAGIAYARPSAVDSTELLRQATVAIAATRRARSSVEYYRPTEDTTSGTSALLLAAELHEALTDKHLMVQYQAIADLHTTAPIGAEAVACWLHPTQGMILSDKFRPVLEQPSLLAPYTEWLLHEALTDRAGWHDLDADLPISINLSARCLLDHGLPAQLSRALADAGLRPNQLMLEFDETAVFAAESTMDAALEELRELGIRVAVDGFGSGPGSLIRLLHLPVTDLKIAAHVTNALLSSPQARAIVRATREIADSMGIRVIATEARTALHLLAARDAGAHAVQGQAIGPPLTSSRAHAQLLDLAFGAATMAQVVQLRPDPDDSA